ncbi:hypothetical protein AJ80_06563 [Polytolypa hystricis UAMH7299]|uniref:Uncharacterized protein n=1 Tax=Polytolypa hystricis (strain UAMH7299) TaxID=1447883 RepID=A0A2B7XM68_POLH7|nr:hypothetical protein AJ80_06563 [Polytolypa hystricis UAMH7299]
MEPWTFHGFISMKCTTRFTVVKELQWPASRKRNQAGVTSHQGVLNLEFIGKVLAVEESCVTNSIVILVVSGQPNIMEYILPSQDQPRFDKYQIRPDVNKF